MPGDGIGPEVTQGAIAVLDAACSLSPGLTLEYRHVSAGAGEYLASGECLPAPALRAALESDAVLLGAMGLPDVRREDGTELAPQVELRMKLDLFAGIRPVRGFQGLPRVLTGVAPEKIDFVIVRESTEGSFASLDSGIRLRDEVAVDTSIITRSGSQRVCRSAFQLARHRAAQMARPGFVTCVDKANILRSHAFFRSIFDEVARDYDQVESRHLYVDAAALSLAAHPDEFDVLVTENLLGDILSDLGAALVGGLGLAPSADIGERHAVFQPVHGTAPGLTGRGVANPAAAILSAAMMLEWLAIRRHDDPAGRAARLIRDAVERVVGVDEVRTPDLGGTAALSDVVSSVIERLRETPEPKAAAPQVVLAAPASPRAARPRLLHPGDQVRFSASGAERVRSMPEAWGLHRALETGEQGIVVDLQTDGDDTVVTVEFETGSAHYWPAEAFEPV